MTDEGLPTGFALSEDAAVATSRLDALLPEKVRLLSLVDSGCQLVGDGANDTSDRLFKAALAGNWVCRVSVEYRVHDPVRFAPVRQFPKDVCSSMLLAGCLSRRYLHTGVNGRADLGHVLANEL